MRAGPPVRSPRCPTCPSVLASRRFLFQSPPAHVSALSGAGSNGPASGPVIQRPPGRRPQVLLPLLSCCLSAARHPLLGTPIPPGDSAPLPLGLPHHLRIPAPEIRTLTRFPPSAHVRPGPGRAPSLPRGQRCLLAIAASVAAACRLPATGPYHPGTTAQPGMRS